MGFRRRHSVTCFYNHPRNQLFATMNKRFSDKDSYLWYIQMKTSIMFKFLLTGLKPKLNKGSIYKEWIPMTALSSQLHLNFPVMGCPGPACNTLVVTWFQLLAIPSVDKIWKQLAGWLRWKFREKYILLLFQPRSKLIILWEIIVTGQLLEFLILKQQQQSLRSSELIKLIISVEFTADD